MLEYKEWRKFENVILRAQKLCENSKFNVFDHFGGVDKMVELGKIEKRKIIH